MFYLVNKENKLIRESENRMALRRIRRKSKEVAELRITEGITFKDSLKVKVIAKPIAKVEAKKVAPKKVVLKKAIVKKAIVKK